VTLDHRDREAIETKAFIAELFSSEQPALASTVMGFHPRDWNI